MISLERDGGNAYTWFWVTWFWGRCDLLLLAWHTVSPQPLAGYNSTKKSLLCQKFSRENILHRLWKATRDFLSEHYCYSWALMSSIRVKFHFNTCSSDEIFNNFNWYVLVANFSDWSSMVHLLVELSWYFFHLSLLQTIVKPGICYVRGIAFTN